MPHRWPAPATGVAVALRYSAQLLDGGLVADRQLRPPFALAVKEIGCFSLCAHLCCLRVFLLNKQKQAVLSSGGLKPQ